jgi:hypothetical protein
MSFLSSGFPLVIAVVGIVSFLGCGHLAQIGKEQAETEAIERTTEKGPVKLTIRITPAAPRLSDMLDMDVIVAAPADVEVKAPEFGEGVGEFMVRNYTEKRDSAATSKPDNSNRQFHYELEPSSAGRHLIRSVAIEFIDHRPNSEARDKNSLIESDPIEINIKSEFGDKVPKLSDLDPMLPPRPLPLASKWPWLVGAAVCIALAIAVLFVRRRTQANTVVERPLTPEQIAHAALANLLSENLPSQGRFKDFYLRLTGIVRHFIEGTTGLRAPEQTTEEFMRAMRSQDVFSVERSMRLKEFLEAADMVKYAGQQPESEQVELSINRAREFVDMTSEGAVAVAGNEE